MRKRRANELKNGIWNSVIVPSLSRLQRSGNLSQTTWLVDFDICLVSNFI